MQRDPPGMPAHDLHDEHAVVRLRRRMQPVDRIDSDLYGGVEAEGVVGRVEVVVDGLRYADHVQTRARKLGRDAERVLTANRDEGVDAE